MKDDVRSLIHTPVQSFKEFVEYVEHCQSSSGITWGVPALDKVIVPARPGRFVSIIGRPGSAKTSLLIYLARKEGQRIIANNEQDKRCVVFVTWEQTVPELEAMIQAGNNFTLEDISWGRVNPDDIIPLVGNRSRLPIWIIGMGLIDAGVGRMRMTPEVIFKAVEAIYEDYGMKPTVLFFDYIQLIPPRKMTDNKWEQVYEAVKETKRLANSLGVPIFAAAQAKPEVDHRPDKMPRLGDGQMSSALEQASDTMLGIARPITFKDEIKGDYIQTDKGFYKITDQLLVMKLLKQRGASPHGKWFLYFDPARFILSEMQPE